MAPGCHKPALAVICGPTGAGKTAVAVRVAAACGAEIVNADSMQIYRYMDIGTAKPTAAEQARVRHHMIDIVDPDAPYDAAHFAADARRRIADLHRRGTAAMVVGGTGFYIKALLHGLFEAAPGDPRVRRRLAGEADSIGIERLHARLQRCDPQTAARVHPHDTYRVLRALEVFEASGRPISAHQSGHGFGRTPFRVLKFGLQLERQSLYERIDRRVEAMMEAGFVDEVRRLLDMGYGPELKSMQAIGYRHLLDHLLAGEPRAETVARIQRDSRRYAKRQLTWFRADPEVCWCAPDELLSRGERIAAFLKDSEPDEP